MAERGDPASLTGTLLRDAGGFALRVEGGATYRLLLHRVPVDHVEKRVRVMGTWIDTQTIEAAGVASA